MVRAPNISSDKATGIGNWMQGQFIARFRQYQGESGNNPLMPWNMYADMTDADLAAIYAYLMASEARSNAVVVWESGSE